MSKTEVEAPVSLLKITSENSDNKLKYRCHYKPHSSQVYFS